MKMSGFIIAFSMFVVGCASNSDMSSSEIGDDGNSQRASVSFNDISQNDLEHAQTHFKHARTGVDVDLETFRSIVSGVDSQELFSKLGEPFNVVSQADIQVWEYDINLPISSNTHRLVCQTQFQIDPSNKTVSEVNFRRSQCENIHQQQPADTDLPVEEAIALVPALPSGFPIYFDFAESGLTKKAQGQLDNLINAYQISDFSIALKSYADRVGSERANLILSERRAESIAEYLVVNGIPEKRINIYPMGESLPLIGCDQTENDKLETCLAPNRRTDIVVSKL